VRALRGGCPAGVRRLPPSAPLDHRGHVISRGLSLVRLDGDNDVPANVPPATPPLLPAQRRLDVPADVPPPDTPARPPAVLEAQDRVLEQPSVSPVMPGPAPDMMTPRHAPSEHAALNPARDSETNGEHNRGRPLAGAVPHHAALDMSGVLVQVAVKPVRVIGGKSA
jgi:hypothetical protein